MRLLHTMLRVGDYQRSIDFYTRVLGMTLLLVALDRFFRIGLGRRQILLKLGVFHFGRVCAHE